MRLCVIAAVILLSACKLALPEKTSDLPTGNPVTSGQIKVTPLDAPADPVVQAPTPTQPAATPEPDPAAKPKAEPAPAKSDAQIACAKSKGSWVRAGKTGTMSCQHQLRDSGKQCSRDRDCDGQCLARSRTCAPFSPLFGCNDVLQDNGQRVTLCID